VPPPDFGPLPGRPKFILRSTLDAPMDDAVASLMDPAHLPVMPSGWWRRRPATGLPAKADSLEPRERGWAVRRHRPFSGSRAQRALFGGEVSAQTCFQIPGFRWEVIENSSARMLSLTCLTPEDETRTHVTQVTWWTGAPLLNLAIPALKSGLRTFLDQGGRRAGLQAEGGADACARSGSGDTDLGADWYCALKTAWIDARPTGAAFANPLTPTTLS